MKTRKKPILFYDDLNFQKIELLRQQIRKFMEKNKNSILNLKEQMR